jgi:Arylsulfotransferase (ASST)
MLVGLGAGCGDNEDDDTAGPPPAQHFQTRPDLEPPIVKIETSTPDAAPGYVFLAPKKNVRRSGLMIIDDRGRLVWYKPLDSKGVTDFRVQTYFGQPVLTWWRGRAIDGVGDGYYEIMDNTYNPIATVTAGNGLPGDVHEFLITTRNTALITIYQPRPWDISAVGGPKEGKIFDGVVQEVDIATGQVLFEWHSSDEIDPSESYTKPPSAAKGAKAAPMDYFHINSIEEEPDGNLLVSGRNTHAIYEIDRQTGKVLWRLGGKKSDFTMGRGTAFAWQHDARRQPDGTLTLFDNAADPKTEEYSRVLVLDVDPETKKATLVRSYAHPKRLSAGSQGNAQFLPDGHVFVGWGAQPYFTEFTKDGTVLLAGEFGSGAGADSYRVYRFEWSGRPGGRPDALVTRDESGKLTVSASWNGATEIRRWQVLAGRDANHLQLVKTVPKGGFETPIVVETEQPFVGVRALDDRESILGSSRAVVVPTGNN